MESQLQRTHDHHLNEEDPRHHADLQSGETEHHHDHHGEKKSVLTKVKNKAKKIKDKIKQVGHANDNEGDDYDNDEDEETVDASDVHAAPMVNEPEFISGTALPKQTGANLENPTPLPKQTGANLENPTPLPKQTGPNLENPTAQPKHTGVNLENPTATGLPNLENPASPPEDRQSRTGRDDLGNVGAGTARDRDRHARDEMYSSIGNDKVIETSPLLDDPYIPITNTTRKADYSGAGDVMAEEAPPTFDTKQRADVEDPTVRIGPLGGPEEDPHFPTTRVPDPSNYQTKLADPTGQGGAEVDVVDRLDNLHVGDESEYRKTEPEEMDYTGSHDHIQKMDSEEMDYTGGHDHIQKMDSEDMDYTGSHHHIHKTDTEEMAFAGSHDPQPTPTSEQFTPKSLDAESVPPPRDTVAEKTSVTADKAASAKDMVASKLGGQDDKVEEPTRQKGALESVSEYGHVVVEKLAPVYEIAAGAGSAIMSKMQRGGGEGVGTEGVVKESDKGVSVQEYLVEKFSPGEEDRELSKVISSAIRREGQGQPQVEAEVKERATVEAVVSDEKAAPGVVDRVKGAIGSWLGKNPPGEGEGVEKEITSNLQE